MDAFCDINCRLQHLHLNFSLNNDHLTKTARALLRWFDFKLNSLGVLENRERLLFCEINQPFRALLSHFLYKLDQFRIRQYLEDIRPRLPRLQRLQTSRVQRPSNEETGGFGIGTSSGC